MQTRKRSAFSMSRWTTGFLAGFWVSSLLVVGGLLLAASSSQALYVDLSGIGSGTTHLNVDGFSLTVQSHDYGFVPLDQISIAFNDGPVSLNSVDLLFTNSRAIVLANLMGNFSVISVQQPGLVSVDAGGIQGVHTGILAVGRGAELQGIDFNIVSVGSVDTKPSSPTSPIPEPGAALLFGAGLGLVALRQRGSASPSSFRDEPTR